MDPAMKMVLTPTMSDEDDAEKPLLEDSEQGAPPDKYWLTYWIMFLFGVGSLLPWNMFITAEQYFKEEIFDHPSIQKNFENYLIIAAQVPNVAFLFINAFYKNWLPERIRIISSLIVMLLMMLLTTILAWVDTDSWQMSFFGITMASVVIINIASAIFQGGLFGIVGKFPPRYRQAVMSGQGLGGTFAALANIFSLLGAGGVQNLTKSELETSAVGYFLSADVILIISIVAYIAVMKLPFAVYYSGTKHTSGEEKTSDFKGVMKQMWPMALSVSLVFFVTLGIFPAVSASVRSVNERSDTCTARNSSNGTASRTDPDVAWMCTYFTPVTCFLLFNIADFIGRTLPSRIKKPGPRYLLIPVISRLVFIPLYLFCKFDLEKRPYFNSDAAPIILMVLMALSNGYLGTLSFIYAPSTVSPENGETAGALMAAFLGAGLLSGTLFSFLSADVLVGAVQNGLHSV